MEKRGQRRGGMGFWIFIIILIVLGVLFFFRGQIIGYMSSFDISFLKFW